jgi:hypothetical protein
VEEIRGVTEDDASLPPARLFRGAWSGRGGIYVSFCNRFDAPFIFGEPGFFYGPRWPGDGLAIANFITGIMAIPAFLTRLVGLKLKRNDPWLYVVAAAGTAFIISGVISTAIIGFQGTATLAIAVFGALAGVLFWLIAVKLPVMIWQARAA